MIFNAALPKGFPFVNGMLKKKGLQQLVQRCYLTSGLQTTVEMLDALKHLGFTYATRSGMSIGIEDLIIPQSKAELSAKARDEVIKVEQQYLEGAITNGERYNKVIAVWSDVTEKIADAMFKEMERRDQQGMFNPVYIMADSGARGCKQQIRQLAGMRGLMAKPSGEIIETPIKANFREGLSVLEYFISTHGARKGLADTALKTADSGYLTRRLVDVAQDVIVSDRDCGTLDGIEARAIVESRRDHRAAARPHHRPRRRSSASWIRCRATCCSTLNDEIDEEKAAAVQDAGIEKVKIRSVLTCASRRGVCAKCYGRDLATGKLVEMGLAVGVVAAQSIGEPGTQLTMRTFHIGGTASRISEQSTLDSKHKGVVKFDNLQVVERPNQQGGTELIVMNRNGHLVIQDEKGRDRERYQIPYGARLQGQRRRSRSRTARSSSNGIRTRSRSSRRRPVRSASRTSSRASRFTRTSTRSPACRDSSSSTRRMRRSSRRSRSRATNGNVMRRYIMPVNAHLMVQDGEDGARRRRAREDPARDDEDQGHHGRSAARGGAVRGAQAEGSGGHQRDRRHGEVRRRGQGPAPDPDRRPTTPTPSRGSTRFRAACTSTCRKASACARAIR